jgi:hypothetical protein
LGKDTTLTTGASVMSLSSQSEAEGKESDGALLKRRLASSETLFGVWVETACCATPAWQRSAKRANISAPASSAAKPRRARPDYWALSRDRPEECAESREGALSASRPHFFF